MKGHVINRSLLVAMFYMTCDAIHHLKNIIRVPYWQEAYHYPGLYTPELDAWVAEGTYVPHRNFTPDFRLEEPYFTVYNKDFFREYYRPYRLSPLFKQQKFFDKNEKSYLLGCYCCTVYRVHNILGTCSLLTQRHILTTATSTDVVLRNYKPLPNLEHILGIWYEHTADTYNASTYHSGPSRIHYHPAYRRDYEGNVSHPIPCLYDLAVWTTYYNLGTSYWPTIVLCQRAASTWKKYTHSIAYTYSDRHFVVGYLFMKAYGRRPIPSFKFGVRTNRFLFPCPKTEWQWFHCIQGEWARLGMDSGGALHLMDLEKTGREDGLTGICAFSMTLRSKDIIHYFTVVDTHPVLDFLIDAYNGKNQYKFLDSRFYDSQGEAPRLYVHYYIATYYNTCFQPYLYEPPNYRR
ncbi:unnamed protein product [Arctia plantaginis]|uniref:Uncharacterized protein n=1 Tax=Arctia plantaginis TaxID=874455 RepID=A0A8S1BMZ4_ARCPL|nr:unnamed protein product [Arctia plantaginis]